MCNMDLLRRRLLWRNKKRNIDSLSSTTIPLILGVTPPPFRLPDKDFFKSKIIEDLFLESLKKVETLPEDKRENAYEKIYYTFGKIYYTLEKL